MKIIITPRDIANLQAVIDSMPHGEVKFIGDFDLNAPLTVAKSNITLDYSDAHINQTGNFRTLTFQGSADPLSAALATDALVKSSTLTLAPGQGANFSPGDWILVRSEETVTSDLNRQGELQQIDSVVGDTLGLRGMLLHDYQIPNSPAVKKLSPLENIVLYGLKIDNIAGAANPNDFVTLRLCKDFQMEDVHFTHGEASAVELNTCWNGSVAKMWVQDFLANGFNEYGIKARGATQWLKISHLHSLRIRHAFTTVGPIDFNGLSIDYGMPRFVGIENSDAKFNTSSGFDSHWNGEFITYTNCDSFGCGGSGFSSRSRSSLYNGCHAVANAVYGFHFKAPDCQDPKVVNSRAIDNVNAGVRVDSGVAEYSIVNNTLKGNSQPIDDQSGSGSIKENNI